MSGRKQVIIRFTPEGFEQHDEVVLNIIKEDTDTDQFFSKPSFPPIYHPPPLTQEAITKLKALDGVDVIIAQGED
ncbi:hypothetical protein BDV32DRAFT_146455 [Aspergillus pseudonomiae]|uniref:Uncharacterized protein n=1 Tax=Aspergillus pseudonomiae TaxID=1506151 RepID=A0A5N6ICY1_9EURO|nr:uncharacterized protein BDV37DRAFT_278990 [Aspergillus pseudonomiae]KAB8263640.1 hypothetical protein BDV32DRAFT_146455 [Aspergillus pseudonomiae]KAE8408504.1 hypothetical protein BDV37DRAFT_278990 [Aspergillus pseudonomiae]